MNNSPNNGWWDDSDMAQAINNSLQPNVIDISIYIYIGGLDGGRWIPSRCTNDRENSFHRYIYIYIYVYIYIYI